MFDNLKEEYETVKSDRASRPRIDVDIRGIKVVIPSGSGLDPEKLIEQKQDWIEEKVEKFAEHRKKIPEREFEKGAQWPYLGQSHTLEVKDSESKRVGGSESKDENPKIQLNQQKIERTSIREELEYFYREEARTYITDLVEKWAGKLNYVYDKIFIRNQRTKWASCSSKSNLNFNFRLMMAPPEIIEYIVIHELCHLKHPNHGARFTRHLSRHCPSYESHEQWLQDNSVKLIFTEEDL